MKNIIYMYSGLDRSNKLLIIIILVIIALLIIIGVYNLIITLLSKSRAKKKYNEIIDQEINDEYKEQEKRIEPVIQEETKSDSINNYNMAVKEEMEEIETLDESVSDIDEILVEMMNLGAQEDFDLTEFEREQEENAIISYGELCKKAGVQKIVYPKKEVDKTVAKKIEKQVYNTEFKPTTVISPIYGVQKEEEKEDSENEFLGKLKEFRSGL